MIPQITSSAFLFPIRLAFAKELLKRLIFWLTVFVILPLLGFYLFQMGELVKETYLVNQYQGQLRELSEKNLQLEEKINSLLSLESMEKEIKELNFVEVSKIKYIPISDSYLVRESR
jgi:hypothetical protein